MTNKYNIRIEEELISFLKLKGKSVITLSIVTSGGGCCGSVYKPEIKMSEPKDLTYYDFYQIGDFDLYIMKNIKVEESGLRFSLNKNVFMKSIAVEGVILKSLI
jgi:hypothetical protein